jgi:hypothetical protein
MFSLYLEIPIPPFHDEMLVFSVPRDRVIGFRLIDEIDGPLES